MPCESTRSTPHSRGATLSRPLMQSSRRGTGQVFPTRNHRKAVARALLLVQFVFVFGFRPGVAREVAHISTPDELITPSCRLHALPT
jgi:hypothetical protein